MHCRCVSTSSKPYVTMISNKSFLHCVFDMTSTFKMTYDCTGCVCCIIKCVCNTGHFKSCVHNHRYDLAVPDFQLAMDLSPAGQPATLRISKLLIKAKQQLAEQLKKQPVMGTILLPTASQLLCSSSAATNASVVGSLPADVLTPVQPLHQQLCSMMPLTYCVVLLKSFGGCYCRCRPEFQTNLLILLQKPTCQVHCQTQFMCTMFCWWVRQVQARQHCSTCW